jgi:CPA2 family monovalent cation:H+ antiporter-2
MHEIGILRDLIVIFGAALAVVVVLSRLHLPAIAGFIVAGVILGPSGLGWVRDASEVQTLAEIGVALLLFTIGLELAPEELRRLGRTLVLGGGLEVALTTGVVALACHLAGLPGPKGIFLGFLVALSSTAIVLKGLADRGEVDAPHGRLTLGILIFQDLCVVPMILLVPALGGHGGGWLAIARALLTAAIVVVATLALARLVVPRALRLVAATRGRDLFILAVVLVAAGIAWLTSLAGASLALGAFLAGVVLAGSEYGHQALADTLSLRDIFTSLFFVSLGMLLDPRVLLREAPLVLALALAVLVGKTLLVTLAGLALRLPLRVALLAGLVLAQVGEFSFVLATMGAHDGLLDAREMGLFFAASVLTLLVTPFALRFGPGIADRASRLGALGRLGAGRGQEPLPSLRGHVVVLGYGVGGGLLVEVLRAAGVPVTAFDLNAERVLEARGRGLPVSYGDVTSREILERAGVAHARQVAVLLNDPDATLRAVRAARLAGPAVAIVARARYVSDVPRLLAAGANEAVAQELEASFAVIERVTREMRTPGPNRAELRERLGLDGSPIAEGVAARLPDGLAVESVAVAEGFWIAGRSVGDAELRRRTGATLVAVSRGAATAVHPSPTDRLEPGDVVCLVGNDRQIAAARDLMVEGPVSDARPGGGPSPGDGAV